MQEPPFLTGFSSSQTRVGAPAQQQRINVLYKKFNLLHLNFLVTLRKNIHSEREECKKLRTSGIRVGIGDGHKLVV